RPTPRARRMRSFRTRTRAPSRAGSWPIWSSSIRTSSPFRPRRSKTSRSRRPLPAERSSSNGDVEPARSDKDNRLDRELLPGPLRQQPHDRAGRKNRNQRAARRRKRRSAPSDLSALQLVRRDDAEQVERQRSDVGEDRELRETAADGERGDDRRVRDDGEVRCAKTRMNSSEHVWEDAVARQREERPRAPE